MVKIADLGFSKQLQDADEEMQTYCGTPLNMAPEIMTSQSYTYKVDIWSIGILLCFLLTGQYPFYATTKPDLIRTIEAGTYALKTKQPLS